MKRELEGQVSVLDVSKDGYYTSEKCIPDFLQAADIIEANHKGKYKPVFLIDHSPIHRYVCLKEFF